MNPSTSLLSQAYIRVASARGSDAFARRAAPGRRAESSSAPCKFNLTPRCSLETPGIVVNLSEDPRLSPLRSHRGEFDNLRTEQMHYSVSLERCELGSQIQFKWINYLKR